MPKFNNSEKNHTNFNKITEIHPTKTLPEIFEGNFEAYRPVGNFPIRPSPTRCGVFFEHPTSLPHQVGKLYQIICWAPLKTKVSKKLVRNEAFTSDKSIRDENNFRQKNPTQKRFSVCLSNLSVYSNFESATNLFYSNQNSVSPEHSSCTSYSNLNRRMSRSLNADDFNSLRIENLRMDDSETHFTSSSRSINAMNSTNTIQKSFEFFNPISNRNF